MTEKSAEVKQVQMDGIIRGKEAKEMQKERKERREKQKLWVAAINIFCMVVILCIILLDKKGPPVDTAIWMSFATMISITGSYLFGEMWTDMNITKSTLKV